MILAGDALEEVVDDAMPVHQQRPGQTSIDVVSWESVVVPAGGYVLTWAMCELDMPNDVTAIFSGRSSHMRAGLTTPTGFIDPGFRGQLAIELFNNGHEPFKVSKNEPVGRLTFIKLSEPVEGGREQWGRTAEVLWRNTRDTGDCIEWTGATNEKGYGVISSPAGWSSLAHRVSYRLEHGEPDSQVLHSCDNPPCVNPDHLHEGDNSQNQLESVARGRHSSAKLDPDEVSEIRELYYTTNITQCELAERYGIAQSNISRIVNHKRYDLEGGWSE